MKIFRFLRKYFDRITIFLAISIVFFIPFSWPFTLPFIWMWVIICILRGNFKQRFMEMQHREFFYIPLIYLGLNLFSLFYSVDKLNGYSTLETELLLIIFPLLFGFSSEILNKNKDILLQTFVASNIIAGFVCLFIAIYKSINIINGILLFSSDINNFLYLKFSIFNHTTYAGMYMVFSQLIIYYFIRNGKLRVINGKILLCILMCFVILLSSRAIYLTCFALLILWLYQNYQKTQKIRLILFTLILFIFSLIILFLNPRINHQLFPSSETISKPARTGRLLIFRESIEIIEANLFFGVGIGDVKGELVKKYKKDRLFDAASHTLNAHNQYFETLIAIGLPGLFFLLLLLFYPIIHIYNDLRKDYLFLGFVFIISINFLFESILNKFSGVLFFAFFYNLLACPFTKPVQTD